MQREAGELSGGQLYITLVVYKGSVLKKWLTDVRRSHATFSVCIFQKKLKMSQDSSMEASIAEKCLEFARDINQNNKMFSLNLKFSNGFNFEFCTVEKRNTLHKNEQKIKKPSQSTLRRNRKRMQEFIEKKKKSSNDTASAEATGGPSNLPPVETTKESVSGEPSDVSLVFKDNLQEENKCEECGFKAKNNCGLKMHISKQHVISQIDGANADVEEVTSKETQTDESCHYCKDFIESLDKHNISGFCPKNKAAQTQALYQRYGHQSSGLGSGFPPSQFGW